MDTMYKLLIIRIIGGISGIAGLAIIATQNWKIAVGVFLFGWMLNIERKFK